MIEPVFIGTAFIEPESRTPRRRGLRGAVWLTALACVTFAIGCTSIPRAELVTYRDSFDAVRSLGEDVILEYGRLKVRNEATAAALAQATSDAPLGIEFDPIAIVVNESEPGQVAVRLAAWEINARYNDALLALADGRPIEEIESAVGGLYESLRSFPIEDVADTVAGIAPYLGVIKTAVTLVERELEARRFREAVRAAKPVVDEFVLLLAEDAATIWEIHATMTRESYDQRLIDGVSELRTFGRLVKDVPRPADGQLDAIAQRIDALRETLYNPEQSGVPLLSERLPPNTGDDSGLDAAFVQQMSDLADRVAVAYADANAHRAELVAFRDFLERYLVLLRVMGTNFERLSTAVERESDVTLTLARVTMLIAGAREAYTIYQDVRR